jgi:hypothetical protein
MLNKYTELYDKVVNDLVNMHNANMHFQRRPSQTSALKVRHAIAALDADIERLRKSVLQFQREYKAELKQKRLEYKASLKEKREARAKRRELKEKQNVNTK